MQQQLSFGDATQEPQVNIFLAIFPDAVACAAIVALGEDVRARHELRGALRRPELLHATLCHLGEFAGLPPGLHERVLTAMDGFAAAPFDVTFDRVGSFASGKGKSPCVLLGREGDSPLRDLHGDLRTRLLRAGLGRHIDKAFEPHVTACYDLRQVPTFAVPPIGWRVGEFVLVQSLTGRGEYRSLARWTLRD